MTHDIALAPRDALIVIAHLWFAYQGGMFSRGGKGAAQWAWFALIAVFVPCAFNGYGLPATGALLGLDGALIHAVHYWGHRLLVGAAWVPAVSAAPRII